MPTLRIRNQNGSMDDSAAAILRECCREGRLDLETVGTGGQLFCRPRNRSYLYCNLLMLKSEGSVSKVRRSLAGIPAMCLLAVCLVLLLAGAPGAWAQGTTEFTLSTATLDPQAVAPGGTSSSSITIGAVGNFSGTVNLGCQVNSNQATTSPPVCTVSPTAVTPPATATATITTTSMTTTVGYGITITGTGPTTTYSAPPLSLTVLAVTPQFTITIQSAVSPTSVPAGSGAEGVVSVNPINGYLSPNNGGVTLYCSSMTPLVTIAPTCSFSYPTGQTSLPVNGTPATSTLTISTFGATTTQCATFHSRRFYAFWFGLPMLTFVGLGAAAGGKHSRRAFGLMALFVISAGILLMPACGNTNNTTCTPNGVTPANTYSFTVVGIDSNGVLSSNTGSTTSAGPTVTLGVTAPPATH